MPGFPIPLMHFPESGGELPMGGMLLWLDPSDLSTMFQNTNFTNPVTADGDPVGSMLDKSGLGNHVVRVGASMVYRTDGTLHWIEYANTYLRCSTFSGASSIPQLSTFHGWKLRGGGSTNRINLVLCNTAITAVAIEWQEQSNTTIYTNAIVQSIGAASTAPSIEEIYFDGTASGFAKLKFQKNLNTPITFGGSTPTATTTPASCTEFRWPCFNTGFPGGGGGEVTGIVLYSQLYSGAELLQIKEYYAQKTGIII